MLVKFISTTRLRTLRKVKLTCIFQQVDMESGVRRGKFRILGTGKSLASSKARDDFSKEVKKDQAKKKLASCSRGTTSQNVTGIHSDQELKKGRKGGKKSKANQQNNSSKPYKLLSPDSSATDEAGRLISESEDTKSSTAFGQQRVLIATQEGASLRVGLGASLAEFREDSSADSEREPDFGNEPKKSVKVPTSAKVSNQVRLSGTVNPQIMRLVSEQQSLDSELIYDNRASRSSSMQLSPKLASLATLSAAKLASEDRWRGLVRDQLSPRFAPANSLISLPSSNTERQTGRDVIEKQDFEQAADCGDNKASGRGH